MSLFQSSPMQVTVSLLPASLSLVHIPRSRLAQLSHPILRQILQPSPGFLNITLNEFELSLFAEHHVLEDFEPIARRDRQRRRSRSGAGSSQKPAKPEHLVEPIEISYEKWNVLQIDSHSDQMDNSGARVHELSAPLAAAGISILYQSSYMSDFIFVKETRLKEVMKLFASAGFHLYSIPTFENSQTVSPPLSPTTTEDPLTDNAPTEPGAVLTRTRSGTDTSLSSLPSLMEKLRAKEEADEAARAAQPTLVRQKSKSHSPTSGDVRILSPDLTCVGLSDENVDSWGLKLVKLVAFPELIPEFTHSKSSLHKTKPEPVAMSSQIQTPLSETFSPLNSPLDSRHRRASSASSSDTSDDEEAYFSHSPNGNYSTSSLVTSASRSCSDITKSTSAMPSGKVSKHTVATVASLSPIVPPPTLPTRLSIVTNPVLAPVETRFRVPFFSFTRTPEGSSLTTDVTVLMTLFPPHERHMVICGGELDAAEERLASGIDSSVEGDQDEDQGSTLKCLQIDLRRFGLDKHGLVNRFSRVLGEHGINHLYSSTFKTANLLVEKRYALRAQALLRAC